ncbi:MAG: dihydrolipoyllysine-residue acetyltransferase [Pseudomonadota bacterium]
MDVPAPRGGEVAAVHVSTGDKVSQGDLVITLASGAEAGASAAAPPEAAASVAPATVTAAPASEPATVAGLEVRVPNMGDFSDVEIIDVLVKPGDEVAAEAPLITLETDKAAMDVPAPAAGRVAAVHVATGDRVSEGGLIVHLEIIGAPAAAPSSAAPSAAPPSTTKTVDVRVPNMGDFSDVEIIDVLVKAGDDVEAEAPLITLETDKAAMDVPAPSAGRIVSVTVNVADRVSEGDLVATLQTQGAARSAAPAAAPAPVAAPVAAPAPATSTAPSASLPTIDEAGFARAHAGPSVRRFARELGVDLSRVKGSGLKGRIVSDDVKAFVKRIVTGGAAAVAGPALPSVPKVDFARFGEVELQKLSRIQKISGPRLHASWVNLPHVTQFDEADITELEATRKRLKPVAAEQDAKLTPLAFLVRACALVLAEFPVFKASLDPDGESLVLKHYTHIGFAADTPNGLVVPVIRDADKRDLFDIARELGTLAGLAREGKLKSDQMQGGVFTISSLGGIGGTAFTPIINAPEVAILGVSRSAMTPVWDGEAFQPRLMLPLSLSYDHRVIDGAAAVRFTTRLGEVISEVTQLLPEELRV